MTQPSRRPALPRGVASSARLYLRPIALADAEAASALTADGRALPLAGGPLAFAACEVVVREAGGPAPRATASIAQVRAWAAALDDSPRRRVEDLLGRLSAPRPGLLGLSFARPLVMGIVNVTPDSFSDGGDFADAGAAIRHARALHAAGADILDVGGESTRPGAEPVPEADELGRVLPVIEGLEGIAAPISIDTRRARVMARALAAGAALINDVSALGAEPENLGAAAASGAPVVLMHSRGEPATMADEAVYDDVLLDVYDELEGRVAACGEAGIPRQRLIVDPGIGFAKTAAHNLEVLRGLSLFHGLGCALMLGASRKLGRPSPDGGPKHRLPASLAAALWGLSQGSHILRVHDVAETRQAIALWAALGAGARTPPAAGD